VQELPLDAVELPLGPLAYGLALAKGSLELGALLVPPDKEAWRNAHLNRSATDRVIPRPLKTVPFLQQLQLLADCIPPADIAGRTSQRPSNDGARHADERALWMNLSIRKRLGM